MARYTKRDRPKNLKRTLGRLLSYLGAYRKLLFLVAFLACVSAASNVLGIYMIRPVVNRYALKGDMGGLLAGALVTALIFSAGVASSFGYVRLMVRLAQKTVLDIRRDLFRVVQSLPVRVTEGRQRGEIMSLFTNDVDTVSEALNESFAACVSYGVQIVGTALVMVILSPVLALIGLAGYSFMFWWLRYSSLRAKSYFDLQQKELGRLNAFIEETVGAGSVMRVWDRSEKELERFREKNGRLMEAGSRAQRYASSQGPTVMGIAYMNFTLAAVAGGILAAKGLMDLGGLASYLLFVRQFTMPVNRFTSQSNVVLNALAGAERIFALMDEEPETDEGSVIREGGFWVRPGEGESAGERVPVRGRIEFDRVSFAYDEGHPVLRELCFTAEPGQKIAFVGSTGAGKTTAASLLCRFYDADGGRISMDGIDVRDIRKSELRGSMAAVLQETNLFTGSVKDNIRFGRPDASDEDVARAAEAAGAGPFIRRLPEGFDTVISPEEGGISEGQRQLLSIARAMIRDPAVLILDEATSSVDTRTEAAIERAADRLMEGRTVLVIAHRLSTVRNADRILVLENGEVLESGTHEELMEKKGRYYGLYRGMYELH